MNSRRKFIVQSGLATTALIAAKPFKTVADAGSSILGLNFTNNKVIFLHTADVHHSNQQQVLDHIAELKRSSGNIVLLNAGKAGSEDSTPLKYDASLCDNNVVDAASNNYRIIYKGNVKIGIITTNRNDNNLYNNINTLAGQLKKERNCHFVVCLSSLGYKHKNGFDNVNLAANTNHLDLIIGGDAKNDARLPAVVLNKDKAEVIINHSTDATTALSKIEITFNDRGLKRNIAFN